MALHWLDEETIADQRSILCNLGYLPSIRFNPVLDIALKQQGLTRSNIYVTQTFHLIPTKRSERISEAAVRQSFDQVTRHELIGRSVVALGDIAARECTRWSIPHRRAYHPSRRGFSNEKNAAEIAGALKTLGFHL